MKYFILFTLCFVLVSTFPKDRVPKPFLSGGEEVVPHSIPYQVKLDLYYDLSESEYYEWSCSGTLISQNYVLTSITCIQWATRGDAIIGAHNVTYKAEEPERVTIKIQDFILPSKYRVDDIGLVKLAEPVNYTDAIQPVILPSRADVDKTYAGETGRISGWGLTKDLSTVLMAINETFTTFETCRGIFEDLDIGNLLTENTICTSSQNVCAAKAGDPIVVDGVQVGLISPEMTLLCLNDLQDLPIIIIKIANFLDFIEENSDVIIQ